MNRIFLAPLLIVLITGCGEPRRVYSDDAVIPEDSAVYRLSEELKRRQQNPLRGAPDQVQETLEQTSVKPSYLQHPQIQKMTDLQKCDESMAVECSLSQFSDRDAAWADPLEGQIRDALASVPNVSKGSFISVRCGRTVCEAAGRIYQQIPSFSKEESYSYLEEMMFSERLADANAMPVEVHIIRPTGTFRVVFERVRQ